jgi:hypothetical protein
MPVGEKRSTLRSHTTQKGPNAFIIRLGLKTRPHPRLQKPADVLVALINESTLPCHPLRGKMGSTGSPRRSDLNSRAYLLAMHRRFKLFYDISRKVGQRYEESGGSRGDSVDDQAGNTRRRFNEPSGCCSTTTKTMAASNFFV